MRLIATLVLVIATTSAALAQAPAPTRVPAGAAIYVPDGDFGMAMAAAILKKKVPVSIVRDKQKATFFLESTSVGTKEGAGERVAKVLAFGVFAGSGKHFDATVTLTNADGSIVFAHNSKKGNFQSAAENVAGELKKHIEKK